MRDFKRISIIRVDEDKRKKGDTHFTIKNPTKYRKVGEGVQGVVFKLSANRCVKLYTSEEHLQRESEALNSIQRFPFAPKLYEVGSNYIIMEYLKGVSLDSYLRKKKNMPQSLTIKILALFKQFKRAGFKRIDARIRHLFITKNKTIKAIDHVNAFQAAPPYPKKLLQDLEKLQLHTSFLKQVKQIDPQRYRKWKNYISNAED